MKATEQDFPVVLFIMLYKVVLPSERVGEILNCYHSGESHQAVLFHSRSYRLEFANVGTLLFSEVEGS